MRASSSSLSFKYLFYLRSPSICGPGSLVGIAIGYGLKGPGIESRWGRDLLHLSRPAVGGHPASCTMDTGCLPGVKNGRGVTLTPHPPLLVPWSRKTRTILLLPLWAVRPAQTLSACARVHFTLLYFTLLPSICLRLLARLPVTSIFFFSNLF